MRHRLSAQAERDLADLWDYVATEAGEGPADRLVDELEDAFEMLGVHPFAARRRPELGDDVRSFPVAGYVIYYKPADVLLVARVLHGRRDQGSAWGSGDTGT